MVRGKELTDQVDARVREVMGYMLSGEWGAEKCLEMSGLFGVTYVAVQDWSRQAGRIIRFMRGTPDEFREHILANIAWAGRQAVTQKRPNYETYIKAQVEQARLLRLDRPEDDATEQLPVEQLAAALRALGHKVELLNDTKTGDGEGTGNDGADE